MKGRNGHYAGKDKVCRAVSCITAHQLSPLTSLFSSFIPPPPIALPDKPATDPPSTVYPGRKDISGTIDYYLTHFLPQRVTERATRTT